MVLLSSHIHQMCIEVPQELIGFDSHIKDGCIGHEQRSGIGGTYGDSHQKLR